MEVDKCNNCNKDVPFHSRNCPYCQADVGFPNVRCAKSKQEVEALNDRYNGAVEEASNGGIASELGEFEKEIEEKSAVVICTTFPRLIKWLEPKSLYTSFHNDVSTGARIAEDNEFDRNRGAVGSLLFPEYFDKINYGALSLNQFGNRYYGGFSVRIKKDAIMSRTSVFHEDSRRFVESKSISAASQIPAGFRSCWENRGKLAVAKLASEIYKGCKNSDFNKILLKPNPEAEKLDGDYIEVHIYGGLIGDAIESIASNFEIDQDIKEEVNIIKRYVRKANQRELSVNFYNEE